MKISLEQVGKRFERHWIFRDLNYTFSSPGKYALLGANGSGKSTLMRILAGMQSATNPGKVHYSAGGTDLPPDKIFPFISYCAPGMELVEELTFREFLDFHRSFKPFLQGMTTARIIELTGLTRSADKLIGDYSSGMKQRVKLVQAICSDTPVLLLDEPCSNLDEAGISQYRLWMEDYTANRLVVIASNDPREYYMCTESIRLDISN